MFTITFKTESGEILSMDDCIDRIESFLEGMLEAEIADGQMDDEDFANVYAQLREVRRVRKEPTDMQKADRIRCRFDHILMAI